MKPPGRLAYSCKYPHCKSKYYKSLTDPNYKNKIFHSFPKDPNRRAKWLKNCQITTDANIDSLNICEDHFRPQDKNQWISNRLMWQAAPIKYISNASDSECEEVSTDPYKENDDSPVDIEEFADNLTREVSAKEWYRIHCSIKTKLFKLRDMANNGNHMEFIRDLYNNGEFEAIEKILQAMPENVEKKFEFIQSDDKQWSVEDIKLALWLRQKSPRLYKYLSSILDLPSTHFLSETISRIPHETGINPTLLDELKVQVAKLNNRDRNCLIFFDEFALKRGFRYEHSRQIISGYEDLGHLGRTTNEASNALVFMIRGVGKPWSQIIAYYFSSGEFSPGQLEQVIPHIVKQLQSVGLRILATICDCRKTYQQAFDLLREENDMYFCVDGYPVCTVFNPRTLLRDTRDALLEDRIEFTRGRSAYFRYITEAFDLDRLRRKYSQLPDLKPEYFNFEDGDVKNNVDVALAQLNYSVAVSIESWVRLGDMPEEAMDTAKFVYQMDCLFDSLTGCRVESDERPFNSAVSNNSPHMALWSQVLEELSTWKLRNVKEYVLVQAWRATITSMVYIWSTLRQDGFRRLSLKSFNNSPLDGVFRNIRRFNGTPTCHQFVNALNTTIVTEEDEFLINLTDLYLKPDATNSFRKLNNLHLRGLSDFDAASYVSGFVLRDLDIPDNCLVCAGNIFAVGFFGRVIEEFREIMFCASDSLVKFAININNLLGVFLQLNSHVSGLEEIFQIFHTDLLNERFCPNHNCEDYIRDKCVKYFICLWVKRKNKLK